ncbi:hypothetical protein DL762_002884 [Monosporascus cannonballus]|uniref:O-methyltransferase C-terminal domain-containing protein n=1 Tax=Monosporascus cannonballus TaxID=155416 RepID=A0ABY0HGK0_9PEZI|nr:hypothetical protein DL762_002884 [Monosporascus cannonballus]
MTSSGPTIDLIEQLSQLSSRLSSGEDTGVRKEALQLSKKLTASLEKPEDVAVALAFSPVIPVTARIAVQLDLFKHIVNNGVPISSKELASLSGGEELLITPCRKFSGTSTLFMGNTMGARTYWVDWFPVQERLLDGATADSALLVDVGGGRGHDLLAFHEKYPRQGRLVLQDLAPVIESTGDLDPAIERVSYDFFTEQPLKGPRAYFYHHILHDWSDGKCMEILARVKTAMKPGYSRLLLHEMIIPEQGASTFHAMLDMTMMAFNAGMERTERQWRELLESVGFQVLKVWSPREEDADGIVEAILKE